MKIKNAFTLIELLAVIVILAIIALIATPTILGIVEDTKKDSFLRSVELVVSTTDIDISNKTFEEEYTYTMTDGVISDLELGIKNTEGMNGYIIYGKDGKEEYAIHNGVYCVIKTNDMENAEISIYENYCSIYPLYQNGQRVYFDVEKGIGCTMKDYVKSYDSSINDFKNSLTGYNGLNGSSSIQNSCLLFYAFNDNGRKTIDLILDHNTVSTTYWSGENIVENNNGPTSLLYALKNSTQQWNGTITPEDYSVSHEGYGNYTILYKSDANGAYKARLIRAQEVAQITGADTKEGLMFDESKITSNNYFYFDSLSQEESSTCSFMSGDLSGCKYGWLYDRTSIDCKDFGCYNNADSNMNGYGYWSSTSVYGNKNSAWDICLLGGLNNASDISSNTLSGVRPVITVLKSKITYGEEPVIPE